MADGSISVKYSERLLLFVEFFSWMLTEDFFEEYHHIAQLRLTGNYASTDEIIGALVRFAMAQENFTNGGAYLMSRSANKKGLFGLPHGFPAHSFIVAHELSHKLLDEVDTAPELAAWVAQHGLTTANREIAADALAVELIKTIHEPYEAYDWVDSAGAVWALTTLQAVDVGSHARLSAANPNFDERLEALAGKFRRSAKIPNPDRRNFLITLSSHKHFIPDSAWDALRFLAKSRFIAVKGRALKAIDLAQFGDAFLVMGKVDAGLNFLRSRTSPGYHFADYAEAISFNQGDDICEYTSRYVERLNIQGSGKEALEDPQHSVRYYDLIDWIWKSPRISELAAEDREVAYGLAIYLASVYAEACRRAQEEQE